MRSEEIAESETFVCGTTIFVVRILAIRHLLFLQIGNPAPEGGVHLPLDDSLGVRFVGDIGYKSSMGCAIFGRKKSQGNITGKLLKQRAKVDARNVFQGTDSPVELPYVALLSRGFPDLLPETRLLQSSPAPCNIGKESVSRGILRKNRFGKRAPEKTQVQIETGAGNCKSNKSRNELFHNTTYYRHEPIKQRKTFGRAA